MSNEQLSGTALMEANAQATIAALNEARVEESHTQALAMNETFDLQTKQSAIEARINSPDVQLLNDEAQIAIFGTNGKTAGFTDNTGNPLTTPIKGKVEEIRESRRFGTKQADREAAVTSYVLGVQELVDDGFQLSQAKLILDIREAREAADAKLRNKLVSNYLTNGVKVDGKAVTAENAVKLAAERVAKDNLRFGDDEALTRRIVKEEGIFSMSEYEDAHFGANGQPSVFEKYRKESVLAANNKVKADEAAAIKAKQAYKQLTRAQVREAEKNGRGDDNKNKDTSSGEFEFPNQQPVRYDVRQDGKVQLGFVVNEAGVKIEIGKHNKTNDSANRKMIATDSEGNRYYVKDRYIHGLGNKNDSDPTIDTKFVGSNLLDPTLGERWEWAKGKVTQNPIVNFEVATEFAAKDTDLDSFAEAGTDPFEDADQLLEYEHQKLVAARTSAHPTTVVRGVAGPNTRRGRLAEKLKPHRRKLLALLGGIACIGIGVSVAVLGDSDNTHKVNQPPAQAQKAKASGEKQTGSSSSKKQFVAKSAGGHAMSVTLQDGSNPWIVSAQQLGVANTPANAAQIAIYDQEMGNINGFSLDPNDHRANHLADGTVLKLPRS